MVQNMEFYSTSFLAQKDDDFHLIVDLIGLKWFLKAILRPSDDIHAVQSQGLFTSVDPCAAHFHIPITVIWCSQNHSYTNNCHFSSSGFCQKHAVTIEKKEERDEDSETKNLFNLC